jgi:hypothetical protein
LWLWFFFSSFERHHLVLVAFWLSGLMKGHFCGLVYLKPLVCANRGWMTESSERSLRAEGRGKRLRFTRRRRLRAGREATLRSDEHRATGAASRGAAPKRRAPGNRGGEQRGTSFEAPSRRLAGGHGQRSAGRSTGAPQLHPRNHRSGGATKRGHGQLGQRERRQDTEPGNRSRVQLRERRSVRRQDRLGGAPFPGNR